MVTSPFRSAPQQRPLTHPLHLATQDGPDRINESFRNALAFTVPRPRRRQFGQIGLCRRSCLKGGNRPLCGDAQAFDAEMAAKIARHRSARSDDWRTIEAPLDIGPAIDGLAPDMPVLLDCATLWLTNHLLAESDLTEVSEQLVDLLSAVPNPVVVVQTRSVRASCPSTRLPALSRCTGAAEPGLAARSGSCRAGHRRPAERPERTLP